MWFRQMAQLSTTMSKIPIRQPNRQQSKGNRTPRPKRDCVPLNVSLGSLDDTSAMLTDFLHFESFLAIVLLLSRPGGSVVDVHIVHD
jgi:hypothetical protein